MSVLLSVHWGTYWAALGVLTAACVASWFRFVSRRALVRVVFIGVGLEAVSACARWVVTGHPPIFGTFENTIAASWAVGVAVIVMLARQRGDDVSLVAKLVLCWVPGLMIYGLFFPLTPYPLTISERSLIIDIHVLLAWASFAILLSAAMAGVARIVRRSGEEHGSSDRQVLAALGLGFALFTCMIAVGSLYSYVLFADWYRWELVGASAMAAWLGYGASLHAYLMFGWRGRKLAWCAVAMLPLLLMVFWSWSLFSGTYHYFDLTAIRAR